MNVVTFSVLAFWSYTHLPMSLLCLEFIFQKLLSILSSHCSESINVAQNETFSTRVLLSGTLKIQFGTNQICVVYIPLLVLDFFGQNLLYWKCSTGRCIVMLGEICFATSHLVSFNECTTTNISELDGSMLGCLLIL